MKWRTSFCERGEHAVIIVLSASEIMYLLLRIEAA